MKPLRAARGLPVLDGVPAELDVQHVVVDRLGDVDQLLGLGV